MKLSESLRTLLTASLLGSSACVASADNDGVPADSCNVSVADSIAGKVAKPRRNIVGKIIDYFSQTNIDKSEKKFDISVIGGPSYSASTSFEIAGLVSGLYKSRYDSLTPRSDISIYAEGSVTGFYN